MVEVKISNNRTVKFKEELSWWDIQELEASMSNRAVYRGTGKDAEVVFDGDATLKAKVKLLELTIVSITEKVGETTKDIPFNDEWVKSLSKEDGLKVYEVADSFKVEVAGGKG